MTDKKTTEIACPVCRTEGLNKFNLSCSNCSGYGLGLIRDNIFYFWGNQIGHIKIELNRLRQKIEKTINLIVFLLGFAGLLSLGFWVFSTINAEGPVMNINNLKFWEIKNIYLLAFWLSTVADMFIFYRLSEEMRKSVKIKPVESRNDSEILTSWEDLKKLKNKKLLVDTSSGYDPKTYSLIEDAFELASKLGAKEASVMHLMFTILSDPQISSLFTRLNVNPTRLVEKIKSQIEKNTEISYKTILSKEVKKVLINAYIEAERQKLNKVETMHLIIPLMQESAILKEIIYDQEIDEDKINNVIKWFLIDRQLIENYRHFRSMSRFKPSGNMDRAYTAVATPILDQFSYDLTVAAKWGKLDMCVGRDKELEKIFTNFEAGKNGVLFHGAPGVGKEAIVKGLAQMMASEDVPRYLKDKRLLELDVAGVVSGGSASESEERLMRVVNELMRAGNIVLYINNIENIMGISAGSEESLELSEVLSSALDRGYLFCIATVTSENYHKYIEGKPLDNAMSKIEILEPIGNEAIQIIESKVSALEGKYRVYFSYNAIEEVVLLSQKYIHDKYLPEKAIDILNLIAVSVSKERGAETMVTKEDIARTISEITKIPITKLSAKESQMLLNLEKLIHERMVDQVEAVDMVASSLRRARANLREGKRPIVNLLFLGPTGVGKTELAKTVSDIYFGDEDYMIRVDMSEYQHADSIEKMIGTPDGNLGYLTEKVRRTPFSLVLLDEFEKAHPDILNLFLQVMDDGRLTDGQGRTIDFTNSIIVATSNAGALYIQDAMKAGETVESIKDTLINDHLNKIMRPELINRFDGVVVFKPLSIEDVEAIARLMLNKTGKILKKKGINFEVRDGAIKILAKLGYDPKFGARPLRRLLQDKIDNMIANTILADGIKRRDTVVVNDQAEIEVVKGIKL